MRRAKSVRTRPILFDRLEPRSLLSTLIALVDSGVDLQSSTDSPYYDFTAAYDAYNQQAAVASGNQVVQDTSLAHGHGATVADFIVQAIQQTESHPGAGSADVKILPIRVTSSGSSVDRNAVIRGVYWAADHGAAVINLSQNYYSDPILNSPGDPHDGASLSQAIAYAQTRGAVVVTGSGNLATDIDRLVVFPPYANDMIYSTAQPVPSNLVVAAAVDSSGNLSSVSSWGPAHVDLGAPANAHGDTSYSAGYTAGVAGVVAALLPSDHTAQNVIKVISQTVTPHAQAVGAWCKTGGVINPASAVALARKGDDVQASPPPANTSAPSAPVTSAPTTLPIQVPRAPLTHHRAIRRISRRAHHERASKPHSRHRPLLWPRSLRTTWHLLLSAVRVTHLSIHNSLRKTA
jgi:hypothetical protein